MMLHEHGKPMISSAALDNDELWLLWCGVLLRLSAQLQMHFSSAGQRRGLQTFGSDR